MSDGKNDDPLAANFGRRITTSRFGSFGFAADFFASTLHNAGPWRVDGSDDTAWLVFEDRRLVCRTVYEGDAKRIADAMNGAGNEAMHIKQLLAQVQADSDRLVALVNAIEVAGFKIKEGHTVQIVPENE